MSTARTWLTRIQRLELPGPVRIMNVCGDHERSVTLSGLRAALPEAIEIVPGPGCPLCVCPEADVYQAIQLALRERVTLVSFAEMLSVPAGSPEGAPRSLAEARDAGADVRPISAPAEARMIAERHPDLPVVFFAAGFETTTAPLSAMLVEGVPDNLTLLLSGRSTRPVVSLLLESGNPGFDALIAPGHVAAVTGPEEWSFVPERFGVPAAVAGFTVDSLLAATYSVRRQHVERRPFLDNCYRGLARPGGNPLAKRHLAAVTEVVDADWRGIGRVPASGLALRPAYAAQDARRRFPDYSRPDDALPVATSGSDCARVLLGRIYPNQCRMFGKACLPQAPLGPCMVSDEGACRIWWSRGVHEAA